MRASSAAGSVSGAIVGLVVLLLVVTPALDLGWNEPTQDGRQGVRCPLHANPAVAAAPALDGAALVWARFAEEPTLERVPLVAPCVFVPPRL